MPQPSVLELAMQASVDEVLGDGVRAVTSTRAVTGKPATASASYPQPAVLLDERRRPIAVKRDKASEEEALQAAEFDRQLEIEAAAATAHLSSLRAAAIAAEDEDEEFGFDPIAYVPTSREPEAALPVDPATHETVVGAVGAGAQATAEVLPAPPPSGAEDVEALLIDQRAKAAELKATAELQRVAELRGQSANALRAVREASGGSADPKVVHILKSASEKADELAAAQLRGNLNGISEDAEEEGEEGEEGGGVEEGTLLAQLAPAHDSGDVESQPSDPGALAAERKRMAEALQRAALEAQWAAVEQSTIAEAERVEQRRAQPLGAKGKGDKIGFAGAVAFFEQEVDMTAYAAVIVREDWSGASCLTRYFPFARPKLRGDHLAAQRDMLMCVAKIAFDESQEVHQRILMSIFKSLTGNTRDPPRFGAHWELVGFQGNDPATDLRGVGMLSLLNALFLVTRRRELAQKLYTLSRGDRDFPFMAVSINLTKVCLEALRSGSLTTAANQRNSVVEAFHDLHCGLYAHMALQWRARLLSIRVHYSLVAPFFGFFSPVLRYNEKENVISHSGTFIFIF